MNVASRTRSRSSKKECGICTETVPNSSFISTKGCDHEYCSDCCKRHAEERIKTGIAQIECPHENCRQKYDIEQCSALLSEPNLDLLKLRQMEAAIPPSLRVYCPYEDCSALMRKPKSCSKTPKHVQCYLCRREFCLKCNVPWHAKKTCEEYRADAENAKLLGDEKLRELAKQEKWQICGKCEHVVERTAGCNRMTCVCGNHFCYGCGANWKTTTCKC